MIFKLKLIRPMIVGAEEIEKAVLLNCLYDFIELSTFHALDFFNVGKTGLFASLLLLVNSALPNLSCTFRLKIEI